MFIFLTDNSSYGGVEQIIVNMADFLETRGMQYKVFAIESGPVMAILQNKINKDRLVGLNELADKNSSYPVDENDVFIMFHPDWCRYFKHANPRFLFWVLYPSIGRLNTFMWPFIRLTKRLAMQRAESNSSVVFMDGNSCRDMERYFKWACSSHYLPVPTRVSETNQNIFKTIRSPINLTYMGRAVAWKVRPLVCFLKKWPASRICPEVHIITENSDAFLALMPDVPHAMTGHIHFHEGIFWKDAQDLIQEFSDLHLSMGTAALDASALGVPTILTDGFCSVDTEKVVGYRWMHETKNFCVGTMLDYDTAYNVARPLEDLLDEFYTDRKKISMRCYEYIKEFHQIDIVGEHLLKYAEKAQGHLGDLIFFKIWYRLQQWSRSVSRQLIIPLRTGVYFRKFVKGKS